MAKKNIKLFNYGSGIKTSSKPEFGKPLTHYFTDPTTYVEVGRDDLVKSLALHNTTELCAIFTDAIKTLVTEDMEEEAILVALRTLKASATAFEHIDGKTTKDFVKSTVAMLEDKLDISYNCINIPVTELI